MYVGALIGVLIAVVIGVAMIPTIIDSTNDAECDGEACSGLIDILPLVFVAVLVIGAVGFIATMMGDKGERKKRKTEIEKQFNEDAGAFDINEEKDFRKNVRDM